MNRRSGERRLKPRFEIVGGELWGRLETTASLVIRNLGLDGALVRGNVALRAGSTHLLTADIEGQPEQLSVRVTRCQAVADPATGYEIGVQFLALSAHMRNFIEGCVASGGSPEATP